MARPPGASVQLEIHHTEHGAVYERCTGATSDRADAGDQLPETEGLDDVVVGPELEADHTVHLLAAGAHHDDWHLGPSPQSTANLVPVDVGKPQVEDHHVDLRCLQRLLAVPGPDHLEALALQALGQGLRNADVVFHQKDLHVAIVRCAHLFSRVKRLCLALRNLQPDPRHD